VYEWLFPIKLEFSIQKKNNIKSESTDLKYELSYNYIYRISCF